MIIKLSDIDSFIFNGGEVSVKLSESQISMLVQSDHAKLIIDATLTNSDDVMKLVMANDAITRIIDRDIERILFMYYVPYARQDRVCATGEALSIKVFADLINSMNFMDVYTADNHSDVATALINNCHSVNQYEFFAKSFSSVIDDIVLVSPDAGANKKTLDFAKKLTKDYTFNVAVVRADKTREVETGNITGTEVYCDDFEERDVYILDDICDGGRTFVELAKVINTKNAGKITLMVTHGIFSKGTEVFDGLIDKIITTDSLPQKKNLLNFEVINI